MTCTNCGQCCNFDKSGHAPFITATDMRVWLDKGLWNIIKRVRFLVGKEKDALDENPRQEWTFENPGGSCYFRFNGKCGIYSVRPLVCAVYPASEDTCINGTMQQCGNKHLLRQFKKAHKEWDQGTDEWRQDTLKKILMEAEDLGFVGFHAQVTPLETIEQAKKRKNL
jgi:Fe-S-cluster containining protein